MFFINEVWAQGLAFNRHQVNGLCSQKASYWCWLHIYTSCPAEAQGTHSCLLQLRGRGFAHLYILGGEKGKCGPWAVGAVL